jgi:hypothetical protein
VIAVRGAHGFWKVSIDGNRGSGDRYAELRRESVIFAGCVDGRIAWMEATNKNG